MNYTKPEVTLLNTAISAIQNQTPGSKIGTTSDHQGQNKYQTAPAYEADE
jgi:hypothetical protein